MYKNKKNDDNNSIFLILFLLFFMVFGFNILTNLFFPKDPIVVDVVDDEIILYDDDVVDDFFSGCNSPACNNSRDDDPNFLSNIVSTLFADPIKLESFSGYSADSLSLISGNTDLSAVDMTNVVYQSDFIFDLNDLVGIDPLPYEYTLDLPAFSCNDYDGRSDSDILLNVGGLKALLVLFRCRELPEIPINTPIFPLSLGFDCLGFGNSNYYIPMLSVKDNFIENYNDSMINYDSENDAFIDFNFDVLYNLENTNQFLKETYSITINFLDDDPIVDLLPIDLSFIMMSGFDDPILDFPNISFDHNVYFGYFEFDNIYYDIDINLNLIDFENGYFAFAYESYLDAPSYLFDFVKTNDDYNFVIDSFAYGDLLGDGSTYLLISFTDFVYRLSINFIFVVGYFN